MFTIDSIKFIVKNNELFALYDNAEIPVVKCTEKLNGTTNTYIVEDCPFCHSKHYHGADFGMRCSHCGNVDKQNTYIIGNEKEYEQCLGKAKNYLRLLYD